MFKIIFYLFLFDIFDFIPFEYLANIHVIIIKILPTLYYLKILLIITDKIITLL